ncbi:acetate/propionate family kinase [Telmatospirillum siberiense]|uniref:Acetate kinase n=1 Tax=Telmatospirillum siberiense TaxID=382514 RepID=A0A2N3PX17_9PROT|nr:acetate kinase [Telmatospirillum siberiense]PKU24938.1 acetate kinase [Telmatospirillum siberiense]
MTKNGSLILVINCGSSSLKFALFPAGEQTPLMSGLAECLGEADARITAKINDAKTTEQLNGQGHAAALDVLLRILAEHDWLTSVKAVGHRMVHGGEAFKASVVVNQAILAEIEAHNNLAPLHNPANLLGIRTALAKMPEIPQVVVFDTAFHQTMPPAAYLYALPMALYREHGVRRYGFHGTSHRFVAEEAVRLLKLDPEDHGLVIAHLGNGGSATAVLNGKSVDTTMGMTPLEGLVMGTRSGDVDPGALIHLARNAGWDINEMDNVLNKKSGLLGISELSNDMRAIEGAAAEGHDGAKKALDVFVHRLARHIGGLATSLPRLDAVVFTGGIGENSSTVRKLTIDRLHVFGIALDDAANEATIRGKSGVISKGKGPLAVVIPTNEEWMIARDAAELAGLVAAH